jgi:hypothetical protein
MTGLNYGTEVQGRRNYKSLILKIPWPQRREIAPSYKKQYWQIKVLA